ncbi:MAG: hypothetical protein RR060_04980, partial [Victivallaceae bacterium]
MLRGNLKLILARLVALVIFCGGILPLCGSHNGKNYETPLVNMTEIAFLRNDFVDLPKYPGVSFLKHFLTLSRTAFWPLSK